MNRKLYALIVIPILLFGCSDRYEREAYDRMDYYIDVIKPRLDKIAIEEPADSSDRVFKITKEEEKEDEIRPYYNLIDNEKMVKELAELYFSYSFGAVYLNDRLSRYKPYYIKKYKNFWILYGCTNLGKAVKKDWNNYREWEERLIFIDAHNGKLILIWQ